MIIFALLLFCITSLFAFFPPKKQKVSLWLFYMVGLLLFLLAAFRDENAVHDYANYVAMYNDAAFNVEISFALISWIVRHVFYDNIIFLFVIFALLGVTLKTKAIKDLTTLTFLSLAIYISEFYILHELTQIRAGVAAGFLLLCIKPIYERNFRRFLLFAICAVLFHYSAILIFLLWFLKSDGTNKYFYAAIVPLAYVFYFLQINLIDIFIHLVPIEYIQQKYTMYELAQEQDIGNYGKINVFNYVFLAKCLIFYVILWKSKVVEEQNRYVNLLLKIESLSLASLVLFSAMPIFAFRISELLGVVEIILIPFIYYVFKPKSLSTALVVSIGLFLLLINIFYGNLIQSN